MANVNSKLREYNVQKTIKSIKRILKEQDRLGNLTKNGKYVLNDEPYLRKIVETEYNYPFLNENSTRSKEISKQYLKTGKALSEKVSKRTGKLYLSVDRETRQLYKSLKEKMRNDKLDFYSFSRKEIVGRDEKDELVFDTAYYGIEDPENIGDFINQLKGLGEVIALRIDLGDPREEVLRDYGY